MEVDISNVPAEVDLGPTSLVELAVSQLSREIFGGALAPGEHLVEEQLTRRFGVSRGPVREALRLLGQQGLVEHLPRRGVRVATLSDRDVDELYSLRDVLERYAVQVALPLCPPLALDGLQVAVEDMRSAAHSRDQAEMAEAHRRFHLNLVALADQRQLLAAYEPVLLKLQLYMAVNLSREAQRSRRFDGVHRHEQLLQAVESDDPDTVIAALTMHGARTYLS